MRRSILATFVVTFLVVFVIGAAVLVNLTGHGAVNWSRIWLIAGVSAVIAGIFTVFNLLENQRIERGYEADIARLTRNESPENEQLQDVQERVRRLTAELQSLSEEETAVRAEIVEGERQRISRELHDSVSQELFAATMILSSVTEAASNVTEAQKMTQTKLALKILHEAQNEMRALLLHLRPTELDGKSLVNGLTDLTNELAEKVAVGISYKLSDIKASSTIEDNLFRMAQEILSNALRHANAENIRLELRDDANNIFLNITDDGVGFDKEAVKQASYGLSNLKERALLLGGDCQFDTARGQGTRVKIRIPKVKD